VTRTHRKQGRFLLLIVVILSAQCFSAPRGTDDHATEHLGTVRFPTSCATGVQEAFDRGVALLHSFEYAEADKQFQQVAQNDPNCAIAYWGQAMSLYHQLWSRPAKTDLRDGWALVRRAQQIKVKTERERDYIHALLEFYRDYEHLSHQQRARSYSRAMEAVHRAYRDDHEAAIFYALSLLSSASPDTELSNEKKAIAILNDLFERMPNHPGVAHYLIHSCDTPRFAQMGLPAARRYASIAPSSPHAVHMPSHIFARLGLWQEDIKSNLAALETASKQAAAHVHVAHHQLHSLVFLEYAYLQIGDDVKAKDVLDQIATVREQQSDETSRDLSDYSFLHSRALLALETRQWKDALALQVPAGVEPHNHAIVMWAHAIAAGHLRDATAARRAVEQYRNAIRTSRESYDEISADRDEAQAWLQFAEGRSEEALRLMRTVAHHQEDGGIGEVDLPAREMLADMLLELKRPREALAEYQKSLRITPNRFNGLYGAARAAELSNAPAKAAAFYAQLRANCEGANSDRPELATALTALQSLHTRQ
jgi:tetratricopeptide (TPR) repeat protein